MTDTEHAPRWLVRWLQIAGLLLVIIGICYVLYLEATASSRLDRDLQRQNCELAGGGASCR